LAEGFRFREHLDELRRRLKVIAASLLVSVLFFLLLPLNPSQLLSLTAVYYTTPVSVFLNHVVHDVLPTGWALIPVRVAAPLEVVFLAALILGVAFDMPVIAYEVFKFIDPALNEKERQMVYPAVASATTLFTVGILFGYFILAKFIFVAMAPFYSAVGLSTPYLLDVSDFYTVVFLSVLFSGAAFTTPVFVFLLMRFGILTPAFFSKNRVYIWVITYVVTALITPDGGPFLDVILFVPVITLLEIAVLLGRRYAPPEEKPEGPVCRYCGAPIGAETRFCPSCGRALA
jgi:Tat protein translocase TatC